MEFLKTIGINDINPGAQIGTTWCSNMSFDLMTSVSPIHGEGIAQVSTCSKGDYQKVIEGAQEAFLEWRNVPAPKRGDIIRQVGDALRLHKDALGSLVSLGGTSTTQDVWLYHAFRARSTPHV